MNNDNEINGLAADGAVPTRPTREDFLAAAELYGSMGMRVVPVCLGPKDTDPITPGVYASVRYADFDERVETRFWWGPHNGIGVRMGDGIVGIDLDLKHDAVAAFEGWVTARGHELPRTLTVATPSGGKHLYFRTVAPIGRSLGATLDGVKLPGVDVLGATSDLLWAPPSVRQSPTGEVLGRYTFSDRAEGDDLIAQLPGWLEEILVRDVPMPAEKPAKAPRATKATKATKDGGDDVGATETGERALKLASKTVEDALEGERNETLFMSAKSLQGFIERHELGLDTAWDTLRKAAEMAGLDAPEIAKTLDSAWKDLRRCTRIEAFDVKLPARLADQFLRDLADEELRVVKAVNLFRWDDTQKFYVYMPDVAPKTAGATGWLAVKLNTYFENAKVVGVEEEKKKKTKERKEADLVIGAPPAKRSVSDFVWNSKIRAEIAASIWLKERLAAQLPAAQAGLIQTRDGVFDIARREVVEPATPARFRTFASAVDWNADAPNPENFLKFFGQSFGSKHDPERAEAHMQALAAALLHTLSGAYRKRSLIWIHGPMDGGKSMLTKVLRWLLGADALEAGDLKALAADAFAMESWIGKRVILFADQNPNTGADTKRVVTTLKNISGGDLMRVRGLYKTAYSVELNAVIWVTANFLPGSMGAEDSAFHRRLVVLDAAVQPDYIEGLEDKLRAELPGILKWVVEVGSEVLLNDKSEIPSPAQEESEAAREGADPRLSWLRDNLVLDPTGFVFEKELFSKWEQHHAENRSRGFLGSQADLVNMVVEQQAVGKGCRRTMRSVDGGRKWCVVGVRLKETLRDQMMALGPILRHHAPN